MPLFPRIDVTLVRYFFGNESVICWIRSARNPFTIRDDRSTTAVMDFYMLSWYLLTCRPVLAQLHLVFIGRHTGFILSTAFAPVYKAIELNISHINNKQLWDRFDLLISKIESKKTREDDGNLNVHCYMLYFKFILAYKSIGAALLNHFILSPFFLSLLDSVILRRPYGFFCRLQSFCFKLMLNINVYYSVFRPNVSAQSWKQKEEK